MALNFPDSPTLNQVYTDSTSGFSYQWNGTVWISYSASTTGNIRELDNISGSFNGSTTIFPLTIGGVAVSPASTNQLLISVGGVMQNPSDDFSVSGTNIVFSTAPVVGLTFFGTLLGTALPVGVSTVGDVYNRQTYSVTGVQTDFSFPSGYTVGYLDVFRNGSRLISGNDFTATTGGSFTLNPPAQNGDDVEAIGYKVSTIAVTEGSVTNLVVNQDAQILGFTTIGANVPSGQTALLVQGNARVTGILTVGSGSITLNGTTDRITVGSGLTLSSSGIVAGVITATTFSGSGSGLTNVNPVGQNTTSQSPTTTIDLSQGSIIYFTHNTDTTVAFANTSTTQQVTFIRTKDNTDTVRNITWPTNIYWDNVEAPTLQNEPASKNTQTFSFTTRDGGVNWVGYQVQRSAGIGTYPYLWGYNAHGQLGQNNITDLYTPKLFENTTLWSNIILGSNSSFAFKSNGTLWAWGYNVFGVLGQNNTTRYSSPVQIPGTTWNSMSSADHSLATKTDGTLWTWGINSQGRLGQNNTTYYSSPVQIPGTTWSSISAGQEHSLATKTDGTLWLWGSNNNGQLGQNDRVSRSSPIQIPGTTWSSISGGSYRALATKTDGTLWTWGQNSLGGLGQNDIVSRSSPVQIPGTSWSSISGVDFHSLATKTDGTLWSWGQNQSGQLGQNNTTLHSSPIQIPGTTWNSISASDHSLATKTDGTLWSWGLNDTGQLGQNNRTQYSSPTQIPGTQWTRPRARGNFSSASKTIT